MAYNCHPNYLHNQWTKEAMSENKPTNQLRNELDHLSIEPADCKRTPDGSLSLST